MVHHSPGTPSLSILLVLAALPVAAGCHSPTQYPRRDAGPRSDARTQGDAASAAPDAACGVVDGAFCTAYAEALCATQFTCCDDATTLPASLEDCEAEVRDECMDLRRDTCAAADVLSFDASAEAAILERLEGARGGCGALPYPEIDHLSALRGTLPEGADCSPVGSDWSRTYACGAGSYCHVADMWDEEGVLRAECRRYAAVGAPCGVDAECAPDAHCASADVESETGTCVQNLAVGAPCVSDDDCDSELCDEVTATCLAGDPHDTWCGEGPE